MAKEAIEALFAKWEKGITKWEKPEIFKQIDATIEAYFSKAITKINLPEKYRHVLETEMFYQAFNFIDLRLILDDEDDDTPLTSDSNEEECIEISGEVFIFFLNLLAESYVTNNIFQEQIDSGVFNEVVTDWRCGNQTPLLTSENKTLLTELLTRDLRNLQQSIQGVTCGAQLASELSTLRTANVAVKQSLTELSQAITDLYQLHDKPTPSFASELGIDVPSADQAHVVNLRLQPCTQAEDTAQVFTPN